MPSIDGRWQWQCLQGNYAATISQVRAAGGRTIVRYTTPAVTNQGDVPGDRLCLPPAGIEPAWVLLDANQRPVTRTAVPGDTLVDIGNPAYQAAAAAHLVDLCRSEGWDGVVLDEVNAVFAYGAWGAVPAKYPTDEAWRAAELSFVTAVAGALRAAGYRCWINLGATDSPWARQVTLACDGACVEYWTGSPDQVAWATWCEQQGSRGIYHATTTDPVAAVNGLAALLLVSHGYGVFCAAVKDYGDDIWPAEFTAATRLGAPLTAQVSGTTHTRRFTNGVVTVDPTSGAGSITLGGQE